MPGTHGGHHKIETGLRWLSRNRQLRGYSEIEFGKSVEYPNPDKRRNPTSEIHLSGNATNQELGRFLLAIGLKMSGSGLETVLQRVGLRRWPLVDRQFEIAA
jgi:hypothetical protein